MFHSQIKRQGRIVKCFFKIVNCQLSIVNFKTLLIATAFFLILPSCKKENKSAQWDINVLAPLFKTTLTVGNMLADTLYTTTPDGRVNIIFTSNGYSPPVDSLFQFHDTLIASSYVAPIAFNIPPGSPFYSLNQTVPLSIPNGVQLKTAIVKKGFAHLIARNKLQAKVIYSFLIPGATLNGNPFSITQSVGAAPAGGVTVFDGTFDITGYTFDLTGPFHNTFNTLTYNVNARTDSASNTVTPLAGDTVFSVFTGFKDLVPLYGKGYLGQGSVTVNNESANIGFTRFIQGGSIVLDSISASIDIKNSVGADAQAVITSFQSVNDRTSTTVSLNAPSVINHTININRASETGPPVSPINSTYNHLGFDQTNSNIIPFLENIPSELNYSLHINFNPLGNISGSTDFIYTDSLFDTKLSLNFPLRFGANQLVFIDTVSSLIKDTGSFSAVGSGNFTIVAYNGFPWEMQLQLSVLDSLTGNVTETLIVPGTIAAAPLNSSLRATDKVRSTLTLPIDDVRKQHILNAKKMIVTGHFSTSAYPQPLQVYSDYELDIRLIGDITYHIR